MVDLTFTAEELAEMRRRGEHADQHHAACDAVWQEQLPLLMLEARRQIAEGATADQLIGLIIHPGATRSGELVAKVVRARDVEREIASAHVVIPIDSAGFGDAARRGAESVDDRERGGVTCVMLDLYTDADGHQTAGTRRTTLYPTSAPGGSA